MATMGLAIFFFIADRAPAVLRYIRRPCVFVAILCCRPVRQATGANAKRILGTDIAPRAARQFTRDVMTSFYDFVADAACSASRSPEELLRQIEQVIGEPAYQAVRQLGRGAVLVTAHMGAFEIGLAALRRVEENVHVVFKRDPSRFESLRKQVRQRLGVHEAPIDDGWPALVQLRDALLADQVVVMQGDRAMPGQKSQTVAFLGGHLQIPTGPVKLAALTASPVVPVFVVRTKSGGFEVHLREPIIIQEQSPAGIEAAVDAVAREIETFVRQHPQQWLVLDRAFVEDQLRAQ
jgi:KDO2-lipid IV(A) lauroyltransferase